jgi:TRAP-type mannitol/chloroaromatic compound transport system permease small subunit
MSDSHFLHQDHDDSAPPRGIARWIGFAAFLGVPLMLLLGAQWPARELFNHETVRINDLGQICFGVLIAFGMAMTIVEDRHVRIEVLARRMPQRMRLLLELAAHLLALLPWLALLLIHGEPFVMNSLRQLEKFPETYNPGYFMLKAGFALFVLFAIAGSLLRVWVLARQVFGRSPAK